MSKISFKMITFYFIIFSIVALTIILTKFRARENDSRLYTKLTTQLTERPLKEIIAPEWRNLSSFTNPDNPYIRDHLAGQFFLPTIISKLGFPSQYSLYFVNTIYRLLSILLLYLLTANFIGKNKAFIMLWALQLNPVNLAYQLRANQEQLILLTTLCAIYGFIKLDKGILYKILLFFGVIFSFLTKGLASAPLAPILLIIWFTIYFKRPFQRKKNLLWLMASYIALLFVLIIYELWFKYTTGYPFFEAYYNIQIFGRSLTDTASTTANPFILQKLKNLFYYISRTLVNGLPWFLFLLISLSINLFKTQKLKIKLDNQTKKLIIILASTPLIYIGLFTFSNRLAQRYIFPSYYFFTALTLVILINNSSWTRNIQTFLKRKFKPYFILTCLWALLTLSAMAIYFIKGGNNHWQI